MKLYALSKTAAIIIAIVVLAAIIGGLYLAMPPKPTTSPTVSPSPTPTETTPSPSPSPTPTPTETTPTETTPTTTPTETTPTPTETETKPQGIVLRVITRHGYDILDAAKERFLKSELAKKYNIVDIRWLPIDPSQWIDVIRSSAETPGREIDVAWGGGPTLFDTLAREGLLAPITSDEIKAILKDIPEEISGSSMMRKDTNGNIVWVAAAISTFGFTINKQKLEEYGLPRPVKWVDLASPDYAITLPTPSVGVADATRSTSNTRMYEIILQIYGWKKGWEIITLMGANARIYDQSGLVRDSVIRGDIAVGITIDFYGYTAQLQNPQQCEYILPEDGTIVNGDPIALLTTSKHKEAAQAFIAWVLSPEGQTVWMLENVNRMPVNAKVFETPEGQNRPDLREAYERTLKASSIEFSDELALSYEEIMRWFFFATITQAHQELQTTWKDIALAHLTGKITKEQFDYLIDKLTNPENIKFKEPETGEELTFTQEVAQQLNEKVLKSADYRNALVKQWIEAAKARYQEVHQELLSIIGG